jgi:hypothetical protein
MIRIPWRLFLPFAALWTQTVWGADHGYWEIPSPDHAQTFAYGSEEHRAWVQRGNHLDLIISFTNEPYVDRSEPRQYDDFSFNFPSVVLGDDARTFYEVREREKIPVAVKHPGPFGPEIGLLPSTFLVIAKPHGYLTLILVVNKARAGILPHK